MYHRTPSPRVPLPHQPGITPSKPDGFHAPVLETLRVSRTPFLRNVVLRTVAPRRSSPAPRGNGRPPSSALSAQIRPALQSRAMHPNVRSSPANVRSSASNRSRELRTSTLHRVAAGTVEERAPARPLAHQKPFLDQAARSHGDVMRVLCRHLVEPALTHPLKGDDDQHLRENPTLAEGAHNASPWGPFASAARPCPVRRYFWCRLCGFSGMVYSIIRSARSLRTTLLS